MDKTFLVMDGGRRPIRRNERSGARAGDGQGYSGACVCDRAIQDIERYDNVMQNVEFQGGQGSVAIRAEGEYEKINSKGIMPRTGAEVP